MTEKIEFERRGDVAVITLNRPQQLNALDPQRNKPVGCEVVLPFVGAPAAR